MELRHFAERVLFAPSLADKLAPPDGPLTDTCPGSPVRAAEPHRPAELRFVYGRQGAKMPRLASLAAPERRGVAHHVMANHELQAVEVMAWVLLAFPDAPPAFRRGLAWILQEEQGHTRWHADRAEQLGVPFGSRRCAGYVWRRATAGGLLEYLACLPLTFEASNLDHSKVFGAAFRAAGDERSAAVMDAIGVDEVGHVRFGLQWLRRLKEPAASDWEAFRAHLLPPMGPANAVGAPAGERNDAARRGAGLDEAFLRELDAALLAGRG